MKVLPGETSLRLEVFRPDISFSWKEVSFQALSLDFTRLVPGFAPAPSQSLWGQGGAGLLHSQRKFPPDVNCILKAIFLAEPCLQPILSSSCSRGRCLPCMLWGYLCNLVLARNSSRGALPA